jgi:hypothetical protein
MEDNAGLDLDQILSDYARRYNALPIKIVIGRHFLHNLMRRPCHMVYHLGGEVLHSYYGVPIEIHDNPYYLELVSEREVVVYTGVTQRLG